MYGNDRFTSNEAAKNQLYAAFPQQQGVDGIAGGNTVSESSDIQPRQPTASDALLAKAEQALHVAAQIEQRLEAVADRAVGPVPQVAGAAVGEKEYGGGPFAHQLEVRLGALANALLRADDHLARLERFV